jgi:hypothetical protein
LRSWLLLLCDERELVFVVLVQVPRAIVVEEELLVLLQIDLGVEGDPVPSLREDVLREDVLSLFAPVVDEASHIAHEPRIHCPLRTHEVVKRVVHAQTLTQQVNAILNHLPAVDDDQLVLFDRLASEQTQTRPWNSRPPHSHLLE